MTYQLQFFSGASEEQLDAPNNSNGTEMGYDGSMSVEHFDPADLPQYLERMDCIFGPCIVIVSYPSPNDPSRTLRSAYQVERKHNY